MRRSLLATLLVFATAAIGLQSSVFNLHTGCACDAVITSNSNVSAASSSCCSSSADVQEANACCSSKALTAKGCCCNPQASSCECSDCGCVDDDDSNSSLPAIPTSETVEVVTLTLTGIAPWVDYPRGNEIKRLVRSNSVAEHAALSSQQTCILLSRFTC